MAERKIKMLGKVGFDLLPIVVIGTDLFAENADWQDDFLELIQLHES